MMMHRDHQDHSNYPLCRKHGKKVSHVLQCQDADAIKRGTERVEGPFTEILVKHSTAPCIKTVILKILPALRQGELITAGPFYKNPGQTFYSSMHQDSYPENYTGPTTRRTDHSS